MSIFLNRLLIVLAVLINESCEQEESFDLVKRDIDFDLSIGETVKLADTELTVTYQGLIENSLCPIPDLCFSEGKFTILLSANVNDHKLGLGRSDANDTLLVTVNDEKYSVNLLEYIWSSNPGERDYGETVLMNITYAD